MISRRRAFSQSRADCQGAGLAHSPDRPGLAEPLFEGLLEQVETGGRLDEDDAPERHRKTGYTDLGNTVVLVNVTLRSGQSLKEAGLPNSALEATQLAPVLDNTDLALKDRLASRREGEPVVVARQVAPKINRSQP